MTELGFLIDLLLNHELQKVTKDAVAERIKEVEARLQPQSQVKMIPVIRNNLTAQAPSILAKYPDLANGPVTPLDDAPIVPIEQIAQTPETMKAIADRQSLVNNAFSGRPEPGRTAPRKIGRQ